MKKIISVALCLVLAFSVLSLCAFAAANGDMNDDNNITTSDARSVLRAAVGLDTLTDEQLIAADIDMDGRVSTSDARLALRISVGLEKTDGGLYKDEFEVFKSGFFYIDMDVVNAEGKQNTKMAITDSSTYLSMNIDAGGLLGEELGFANIGSISMSMLFNEDDTYFIDDKNKAYAPMSELFSVLGDFLGEDLDGDLGGDFSEEDLAGAFADMDMGVDFDLKDADEITTEDLNGESCTKYTFTAADGSSTAVYMNGKKLVTMVFSDENGKEATRYVFNEITLTVPAAYTVPPAGYEELDDPFELLLTLFLENGDLSSFFG